MAIDVEECGPDLSAAPSPRATAPTRSSAWPIRMLGHSDERCLVADHPNVSAVTESTTTLPAVTADKERAGCSARLRTFPAMTLRFASCLRTALPWPWCPRRASARRPPGRANARAPEATSGRPTGAGRTGFESLRRRSALPERESGVDQHAHPHSPTPTPRAPPNPR